MKHIEALAEEILQLDSLGRHEHLGMLAQRFNTASLLQFALSCWCRGTVIDQ